ERGVEVEAERREVLAHAVVQLARQAPALRFLRLDQAPGQRQQVAGGLGEQRALLAQRLLRLAALGHVARHLGEAAQRPRWRAQRRDHHVGPEAAAVLADAPALVPGMAFALGA